MKSHLDKVPVVTNYEMIKPLPHCDFSSALLLGTTCSSGLLLCYIRRVLGLVVLMLLAPLFFFLFFFLVIKCATNSALHVALFEFDLYFACRSAAYDQGFTSMIQTFQKC